MTKLFMVLAVAQKIAVANEAHDVVKEDVKLNWADGMVGAVPVFTDREKAIEYADDRASIHELEVEYEK